MGALADHILVVSGGHHGGPRERYSVTIAGSAVSGIGGWGTRAEAEATRRALLEVLGEPPHATAQDESDRREPTLDSHVLDVTMGLAGIEASNTSIVPARAQELSAICELWSDAIRRIQIALVPDGSGGWVGTPVVVCGAAGVEHDDGAAE